jgi:1-acyl-sn-glycerol-3-phosphate acyltransferase
MLFIRAGLFYSGYWLSIIVYGLLSFPLLLLPQAFASRIMVSWNSFVLFWLRVSCNIKVKIQGNRELPKACVIVANHQSPWETFFFQHYFFPLSVILKKELLRIPFFGWGLRIMDPVAIDRATPMQALKQIRKSSVERLGQGKKIIMFPEGTRMPINQLGDYKRSAADIAQQAKVPLIPIAHNGGKYWLNKKMLKLPGTIQIVIGPAIDLTDKDSKQVMQEVHAWTQTQLDAM